METLFEQPIVEAVEAAGDKEPYLRRNQQDGEYQAAGLHECHQICRLGILEKFSRPEETNCRHAIAVDHPAKYGSFDHRVVENVRVCRQADQNDAGDNRGDFLQRVLGKLPVDPAERQ